MEVKVSALQVNFFFRAGQILFNLACTFAAHHGKGFVSSFFLRSLLITHLITLSLEKEIIVLEKSLEKVFRIQKTVRTLPRLNWQAAYFSMMIPLLNHVIVTRSTTTFHVTYLVPPYGPCAYNMSFALFLQVRLAVNQTILLHEDMQENKEVEEAFMNFFEKKLRY